MSEFNFIKERENQIPEETKVFVKKSFDIIERIHELLHEKKMMQKDLARMLNKSEAELSKWINGAQNFTLKTLAKIEVAFGEDLITVPCKRNELQLVDSIQQRDFAHSQVSTVWAMMYPANTKSIVTQNSAIYNQSKVKYTKRHSEIVFVIGSLNESAVSLEGQNKGGTFKALLYNQQIASMNENADLKS